MDSDEEDEEDAMSADPPVTLAEALRYANLLKQFAAEKGLDNILNTMSSVEGDLEASFVKVKSSARQTSIQHFFKP